MIDYDGNRYLTVAFWIDIDNIIIGLKNIALRKLKEKPYGFDKMYMKKELIEDKLYQTIDQLNKINILICQR